MARFRFQPDHEDMVTILKKKMEGKGSKKMMEGMASTACQLIPEAKLRDYEPWELPGLLFPDDPYAPKAWFCFCRPDYINIKSSRRKRDTKQGYWKSTCDPNEIKSQQLANSVTCKKRTLIFHKGRGRTAVRTRWFMYEYEFIKTGPGSKTNQHTNFVLCRIQNKAADHQSDNKNLNESSISDELAGSGATNHMIPEEEQQPGYQELEHVLPGSNNYHDAELHGRAASAQSVDDMIQEPSAQPGDYMYHQPELPQRHQLPQMGNGSDVYTPEYSNWPSPFEDNDSYLTNKNYTSTNYDTEPVSHRSCNFPSQATDEFYQQVKMNLLSNDVQASAADMISGPVEHRPYEERGERAEPPYGSRLMGNVINDISTSDRDIFSNFSSQATNELFQKFWTELGGENLDLPPPQPTHQLPVNQPPQQHQPPLPHQALHQPQQHQPPLLHLSPHSQGYHSSTLQFPLHTQPGNVPYVFYDWSKQQSAVGDNYSYPAHKNKISRKDLNEPFSNIGNGVQNRATEQRILEVYKHSTDYRNEPVCNTAYNQHNGATYESVSKAYFQPEDNLGSLFHPLDLQDYTLMSPMTGELGDVVHRQ